jgi:hypothetical protein
MSVVVKPEWVIGEITFVQGIVVSVSDEEAKFAMSYSTESVLPLKNRARCQHCQNAVREHVSYRRSNVHMI